MSTNKLTPRLETIVAAKRHTLKQRRAKTPIEAVRALASMQSRPNPILSTVPGPNDPIIIIGQVKHNLAQDGSVIYDPVGAALRYRSLGVDAVSLFTDEIIYENGVNDLMFVSRAVDIPVICQDYILDEYEVIEARAAGASALILSAAILDPVTLRRLISDTQRNRMTAIVEVHTVRQLERALTLSPHVIGISSDDPFTPQIELDLELTRRMRMMIPRHIRVMVLDNLSTMEHVRIVAELGVDAMMVDEHLIDVAQDAAQLRRQFRNS
jgi:indole-3-glycerol phosphate synthase